jgi:hypothetical protein
MLYVVAVFLAPSPCTDEILNTANQLPSPRLLTPSGSALAGKLAALATRQPRFQERLKPHLGASGSGDEAAKGVQLAAEWFDVPLPTAAALTALLVPAVVCHWLTM